MNPAQDHQRQDSISKDSHGQSAPEEQSRRALDEDPTEHSEQDHEDHDHSEHAGHSVAMFKNRFWLSLVLAIPVVFFSPLVAELLGYIPPEFVGANWIAPVFGTVIYFYGGMPFLKGGIDELKSRQPAMMLLIAMAITVAFVISWITSVGIGGFELDFWWELALLVVIMLLGHWMEMRALGAASGALDTLAELLPDEAEKVADSGVVSVSIDELIVGDTVLVRSGARVPADGRISDGEAQFDESMITGESKLVSRQTGEDVVAGTVATDNAVQVMVAATGGDTTLAGIQRMVTDAQQSTSRAQALADQTAALLFWFALSAGVITFVVWLLIGSPDEAVIRTVTVLVIACPHALGLAIPLVIAISTEKAARSGVLIKNRLALEGSRSIDVVLFDKTGTLTHGEHTVTGIASANGITQTGVLVLAAAAEASSEHPVARAITAAAQDSEASDKGLAATDFSAEAGRGVRATVEGSEIMVGGPNLLIQYQLEPPTEISASTKDWAKRGASILHVIQDRTVIGALALEDQIRPESQAAVSALQQRGMKVALITGDAQQVAEAVAQDLGIDEVFAEVLPQDKDSAVTKFQDQGLKVAMVGDGVNDAPALARADVGVAIGAGTDVAMESAGVVLASSDPRAMLSLIDLSQASYRKMVQNLVWASGYNIVAVPLAAGVLAPIGFVLSPAVGAVLMSLSTIIVALNAQLLRNTELNPELLAPTPTKTGTNETKTGSH